jgi:two-component system LytT family response regulator
VRDVRALVVDDELPARRGLARLLAAQPGVVVLGESRNGAEAVRAIRASRPDLVFLDVEMPGLDGFGVLRALDPGPLPLVVFVTAFDDYAVRAFEVHAVDYLVKPFSDRRFADMLARARSRLDGAAAAGDATRRVIAELAEPAVEPGPDVLVATTGRRSVVIRIADVDWIEAQDYCALVHTRGASYLLRKSIRALDHQLAPRGFARVHRSAIVNLARVRELRRPLQAEWSVILDGGVELPVSRRMRPTILRHVRA